METFNMNLTGMPVGIFIAPKTTFNHHQKTTAPSWITHKGFNKYLSLLQALTPLCGNEFKSIHDKASPNIKTSHHQNYRLTPINETPTYKSATNNLNLINSTCIILNFTNQQITTTNHCGLSKSYAPLKINFNFMEEFQNQLHLITIRTIILNKNINIIDYINHLRNKLADKRDVNSSELRNVCEYFLEHYANPETRIMLNNADTCKVATIGNLDSDRVRGFGDSKINVYIRNKKRKISFF